MTKYLFREPEFPLLIETESGVMGAMNGMNLESVISQSNFSSKNHFAIIDSSGEGWSYYPEVDAISPLALDKQWSKKKMIAFYNSFVADVEANGFVGKSLSSKKVSKVIEEIIAFANQP